MKKAIAAGTSAALIASLLATVVAPAAFAANPLTTGVTGIGAVPIGGTSGAVTVTLAEQLVTSIGAAGSAVITLTPNTATWTGTPVLSAPGSLGASVSVSGSVLTVTTTGWDNLNYENVVITGLKVAVSSSAVGATINATLTGSLTSAFLPATTTATGTLQSFIGTATTVNVTSSCGFDVTGAGAGPAGTATFGSQTGVTIGGVTPASGSGSFPGVQAITLAAALSGSHVIGEAVSQTVTICNGVIGTGSIANVVHLTLGNGTAPGCGDYYPPTEVFPGESTQPVTHLVFDETTAGTAAAGTVFTATIQTAGATFSTAPTVQVVHANSNITFVGQNLSYQAPTTLSSDHKSVTFTVNGASTKITLGCDQFKLAAIYDDIASSVASGTSISVLVTAGAVPIQPTSIVNAYVSGGLKVTSTPTTIFIGQNGQKTGPVNVIENSAGFFTDSPVNGGAVNGTNVISYCFDVSDGGIYTGYAESFDTGNPPVATVTNGDLLLRSGSAAAPKGTAVPGTAVWAAYSSVWCYQWTVWSHSTVASTITITAAGGATGASVNVNPAASPGPAIARVWTGSDAINFENNGNGTKVVVANRVFQNSVVVTALSQPTIPQGTADGMAGNIQVAETANGQLTQYEEVCVEVLPRLAGQDSYLGNLNTSELPIATASGGLIISAVDYSNTDCQGNTSLQIGPTDTHISSFSFTVLQQSTSGTGKIVISNMHYIVPADAVSGNVLVNVYGFGLGNFNNPDFQSTVSNAKIGNAPSVPFAVGTAIGATKNATFTAKTKVVKVNSYVTWRFTAPKALAGKTVVIWVSTKLADGTWGAPKALTTRLLDLNGNAYFWWKFAAPTWAAISAQYAGDDTYAMTVSVSPQARWIK